jgi:outer membrane protein OmpA-like peptidoglycan-associated protein
MNLARREPRSYGVPVDARKSMIRDIGGEASRNKPSLSPDAGLVPPDVHQVVNSPSSALDHRARAFFEPRFGFDFSRVRVHADSSAAESARALDATAYTVGRHIVFDAGRYDPRSSGGRRLIAHELAHTIQQSSAIETGKLSIGSPSDTSEREADGAASSALSDGLVAVQSQRPVSVQRQSNQPGPPRLDLAENASPLMAGALGSMTIDGFETGKTNIPSRYQGELTRTAQHILTLLQKYPSSSVQIVGHADSVGQENDNQTLGQSRADSVKAELLRLGVPETMMHTESRGASELAVKTQKAEPRNRRVEMRFQPARAFPSLMSSQLSLGSGPGAGGGAPLEPSPANSCVLFPEHCKAGRPPYQPPGALPSATQSLTLDIPFDLMDSKAYSDAFRSHGNRPDIGGDPREAWAALYRKYRWGWGLSKELAAKAANSELSSTAESDQKRDFPNAQDRFNQEWKNMNPTDKSIGPINPPIKPFKWEF